MEDHYIIITEEMKEFYRLCLKYRVPNGSDSSKTRPDYEYIHKRTGLALSSIPIRYGKIKKLLEAQKNIKEN